MRENPEQRAERERELAEAIEAYQSEPSEENRLLALEAGKQFAGESWLEQIRETQEADNDC